MEWKQTAFTDLQREACGERAVGGEDGGLRNAEEDFIGRVEEESVVHAEKVFLRQEPLAVAEQQPVKAVTIHGEEEPRREAVGVSPLRE